MRSACRFWAPPADAIDEAEDRERFDELLERCGIPRPEGRTVYTLDQALKAAEEVGYPVLMRPSYVLGGQNMIVAYNSADVIEYMGVITAHVDMSHPVLMDKYIYGTECEVDAICDGEDYLVPGIMEQIERTGVHSGDSICVYPPYDFPQSVIDTLVDYTGRFARELKVVGLVNVQYAVQDGKVYVIEVNPRSSRTVPYISKVTGVPMVDLAVRCTLGEKLRDMGYGTGLWRGGQSPYYAVKVPVYSFLKLHWRRHHARPRDEVHRRGAGHRPHLPRSDDEGALSPRATSSRCRVPVPASSSRSRTPTRPKPPSWPGSCTITATRSTARPGTARYLNSQMIPCSVVRQMSGARPNAIDLLESGLVDYIISTSPHGRDPAPRLGQVPPQGHRAVHPLHHGAGHRARAGGCAARRPRHQPHGTCRCSHAAPRCGRALTKTRKTTIEQQESSNGRPAGRPFSAPSRGRSAELCPRMPAAFYDKCQFLEK